MLAFPTMVTFSTGAAGQGSEGAVGSIQGRVVGNTSIRQRSVVAHLYRHSFVRRVAFRPSSGGRRSRAGIMPVFAGLWSAHHSDSGLTRIAGGALGDRPSLSRVYVWRQFIFLCLLAHSIPCSRTTNYPPCSWRVVASLGHTAVFRARRRWIKRLSRASRNWSRECFWCDRLITE